MFDEGVYQRVGMSGMCLGITYIKPLNTEVTDVSSLNFVYSRYYKDSSTAPKKLFEPEKSWKYGPPSLIEYMNTTYSSIQHNMKYNPPLVYQRKGYRGIPTQILCTCDALLLGVLIDKPVQSEFLHGTSHAQLLLLVSQIIFSLFLSSTLPTPSSSLPLQVGSIPLLTPEIVRLNHQADISDIVSYPILFTPKTEINGVTNDEPFLGGLNGSVALILTNMIGKRLVKNTQIFNRFSELMGSRAPQFEDWYSYCIPSVFQPSLFTQRFIDPFLKRISGRYTIGVHVRFESQEEGSEVVQDSTQRFTNKFNMIRNMQRERNAMIVFATDSSEMRTLIHQNFDHDFFMVDYLPVDESGKECTEASAMRTIIELFLLGSSDMLFLMEKSKFSMVGLSLNKKNPQVIYF